MSDSVEETLRSRSHPRIFDALTAVGVVISLVLTLSAARSAEPEIMGAAIVAATLTITAKLISRRLATTGGRAHSPSLAKEGSLPDYRESSPSQPGADRSRLAFGSGVPLYPVPTASDADRINDILHRTEEINRQVAEIVTIAKELQSLPNEGQDAAPEGPSLC